MTSSSSDIDRTKKAVTGALCALLSFACATVFARYLRWEPEFAVRLATFLLLFVILWKEVVRPSWWGGLVRCERVILCAFSAVLSVVLVVGYHIVIGDGDHGTLHDNYITPYSWTDIVALPFLFVTVSVFALRLYAFLKKKASGVHAGSSSATGPSIAPLGGKWVGGLAALIFVLWVPYLLAYWPGFVFGDSMVSIGQAIGQDAWRNNHPFVYTLFIKACLDLAGAFGGDITIGCAIYSVVQMALMAAAFGYACRWVVVRARISSVWGIVIAVAMAATPSIAVYSIALWKDPLFSTAILMMSLLLFDLALTRGRVLSERRSWVPLFAASLLVVLLFRSNGIFIALAVALVLGIVYCVRRRRKESLSAKPFVLSVVVIAVALGITGPGYAALGVQPTARVESVGIFLNQMARVAALDGEMTDADRDYMDALFPLEKYENTYAPGLIDRLKWDPEFNAEPLEDDFFAHWLSMGAHEPRMFFEAWELQTCGFWAINQPAANTAARNIDAGVPRNLYPEYAKGSIAYENKLGSERARSLFPSDERTVPASWLNWAVLYLAICIALLRRKEWLVSLVPTFALVGTLLIASPIWYWPRYEAAVYFLVPFYVALVVMLLKGFPYGDSPSREPRL